MPVMDQEKPITMVVNKRALESVVINEDLMKHAVRLLTQQLDDLVGDCLDESGNLKAPSKKVIMKSKRCLPSWCKNTFEEKTK